jgi:rhodanese-related sulfurtransferase
MNAVERRLRNRGALTSFFHPRSSAFIGGLLLLSLLAGCAGTPKISDEDVKEIQYKPLRDLMENHKKGPTYLLDPRSEARYAQSHLPGAVHIPIRELIPGHPALAEARNIVVYGTTFTDGVAVAAAKKLMAMRYQNVFLFRGGVELWRAEGGRVESSQPETEPAAE